MRPLLRKTTYAMMVSFMVSWVAYGQMSADDSDSQYRETIRKHKAEIQQACAIVMTNIQHELNTIAKKYPSLSGIGLASIVKDGAPDSGNYRLAYMKNVHMARYNPPSGLIPAESVGKLVIDTDGALLEISIQNNSDLSGVVPISHDLGGGYYPLLLNGGQIDMVLIYNLSLNSPDPALEKTVKDIVENNVKLLRNQLQDILGVDPTAEKAQVYAPVMTNILHKLQDLAQLYPMLSNVSSATIENKGTNYIYQHLHYWRNAHFATTNDALPHQAPSPLDIPFVEKGGIALDIYLQNEDEPFGFRPDNTDTLISPDHRTQLYYSLYFNRRDQIYDSPALVKATNKAIRDIIENQRGILRQDLNNIVDF